MPEPTQIVGDEIGRSLDEPSLRAWVQRQRWYGSKSRHLDAVAIIEGAVLSETPLVYLAIVEVRFSDGARERYQLPLRLATSAQPGAIARAGEFVLRDALEDPHELGELVRRMEAEEELEAGEGSFRFHHVHGSGSLPAGASVQPIGVEQSNSSLVFGDDLVLKLLRKIEPGVNPELEMVRFLTAHGFPHIAPLRGWYEYEGAVLSATLGVAQRFFSTATGGWELALGRIGTDPEWLLDQLGSLGAVTAGMHTCLASDPSDPAFCSEAPDTDALSELTAAVDREIAQIFERLPADERVAPIAGRGAELRALLGRLAAGGIGARLTRTHGDYHLGQTLHTPEGWVIIDFEGEPARPLPERRAKRSPLRDVAGMLRSFAYAASSAQLQPGGHAPAGFEANARERFLAHYLDTVEESLLPASEAAIRNVLAIFELEKVIYELGYELDNRPDWVPIPVAGIRRLLEEI